MVCTNWDLSQIYSSNEEFKKDLENVKKMLKNLEKYKNKLNKNDKKIILKYFKDDTEFGIILEKLAVYARVKIDDNGKDEDAIKNYAEINGLFAQMGQKLAFVKTELASLSDEFLIEMQKDKDFKDFDREIEDILRHKKHTLSEEKESLIASISDFNNTDDIFDTLSDVEMDHGEFIDKNGEVHKLTTGNFSSFLKSKDQNERKKIYSAYLGKYKELNLTLGNLYLSHVKYVNFLAKVHEFNSAKEMLAFNEEVDPNIMETNIKNVYSNVGLLQEFFKLKKKTLGLDEFYVSDIYASMTNTFEDKIDYSTAVQDVKSSFLVLGQDYVDVFEKALSEGWIDAFPRENKASGGYTIHTFSIHPYILLNYDETAHWKSAIAHEFGHAMHSYYSAQSQPYAKSNYTIFVAEVASLTNEILLTNYELEKEENKEKKIAIISEFLQNFYLNVFNSSMLAEFEIYVHESLQNGEVVSPSDLNKKYVELANKYFGNSVKLNDEYAYDWCRRSHFFRDYYLYKYSTGFICASAISKKILDDKTGEYVKKYKKFLSLGGSKDPVSSLLEADVDILSGATYKLAFDLFAKYLNELKKLLK
jgi:oligoendopeptidase F